MLTPDYVNSPEMTGTPGDYLGSAIGVVGDHMIAIAAYDDLSGASLAGTLHAYRRINGMWVFQNRQLTVMPGVPAMFRPRSLDVSGERMIIGGTGGQYLIIRQLGDGWQVESIDAAVPMLSDAPSFAGVTIDGDRALVVSSATGTVLELRWDGNKWVMGSTFETSPQFQGEFGSRISIDLDDNRLIIGNPYRSDMAAARVGRVLVYRLDGNVWTFEATLAPMTASPGLLFGVHVAISSENIAVGAPLANVDTRNGVGSVTLFQLNGGQWTTSATFTPDSAPAGAGFGNRVFFAGSRLYVGAPHTFFNANHDGAMFEYRFDGVAPLLVNQIIEPGSREWLGYGFSVQGDELMAGVPTRQGKGGVKAFARNVSGGWDLKQVIEQPLTIGGVEFGSAVAVDGTHLLVRERFAPIGNGPPGSVVHAYESDGTNWRRVQTIQPPDGASTIWFGSDIEIKGDTAALGTNTPNGDGELMVDTYRFIGGVWTHVDSENLSALRTAYGYSTDGMNLAFGDDFLAVSLRSSSSRNEGSPVQAVRVFSIDDSGHLGNWQALLASARGPWNNFARSIATDGQRVAAYDAYGSISATHVRGVTSIFERVGGTWVRSQLVPAAAQRPIGACGLGAMELFGEIALDNSRLFASNGGGELPDGSARDARIDTFDIAGGQSSLIDSVPTDTLALRQLPGHLATFRYGEVKVFASSAPLSQQSPRLIVSPRSYYAPVFDISAGSTVFGIPWVDDYSATYMGEVYVQGNGFTTTVTAPVPTNRSAALLLLALSTLLLATWKFRRTAKLG